MARRRTPEEIQHEKRVAAPAVDFAEFMSAHTEREIIVWQRVLAETQLKLAKWAAEPEPKTEKN